ncbi:MAG: LamG domain-containing protein [Polyangiaceae bacterium]
MRAAPVCILVLACGTPSPGTDGPIENLPPDSSVDLALEFDGVNDYASMGTAGFPFPRLPQTISFWLSAAAAGPADQVIATLNKDTGNGVLVGLCNGVPCARSVYTQDPYVQATSALAPDTWHHFAYMYDGTDSSPHHSLYIDGLLVGNGNALPNKRTPTTAFIGSDNLQRAYFKGKLDELRVWTSARTQEQVSAEIAGEAPEQEPPDLVLYYTFNEASGPRVIDRSGRENHALLGDGLGSYMPKRALSGVLQARK